jgi:hypothetical protein
MKSYTALATRLSGAAYETAARMHPRDRIGYRQGALVMGRNYSDDGGAG